MKPTEQQKEAASIWLAKWAGKSLTESELEQLETWLDTDVGNRLAFNQMQALWGDLELPAQKLKAAEASRGSAPEPIAIRSKKLIMYFAMAMAACLVALLLNPFAFTNWTADIVSGADVVTVAELPDGSVVHLGAHTALKTDFSGGDRQIELLRGQAFFKVEKNKGQKFIVMTDQSRIEVVGTRFDVNRLLDKTVINVEEGKVRVARSTGEGAVLLERDQKIVVDNVETGPVMAANMENALSWMEGRITVEGMAVSDLVSVIDRYAKGRILVLGTSGDKKVSGTFPLSDVPSVLKTVANAVGVKLVRTSPWLTVIY